MIAIGNGDDNYDEIRKGAFMGARKLLRGRHEHSVCVDIASDAVEYALRAGTTVENPYAWGRTFGYRKAVSHIRKCTAERRFKTNLSQQRADHVEDVAIAIHQNDFAKSIARQALDLLPTRDALYLLSCMLCEYSVEELGLIINQIDKVTSSTKSHENQLKAAIRKLQIQVRC